jgi:hypothetical protein
MWPVVLLLFVAATEPAAGERITRGRAAYDALDFDVAAIEFSLAARDSLASDEERLEANLWAGAAHRVLGHDTDARLHFIYVLRRAPEHQPPAEFAPKIADFYALVREEIETAPRPAAIAPPPVPPPLPALATLGSSALFAGGAVAVVFGAQPFFAHDDARTRLLQAAANGDDGSSAADAQVAARTAWESWGGPLVVGGAAAMAVGGVGAVLGGLWWAGEP